MAKFYYSLNLSRHFEAETLFDIFDCKTILRQHSIFKLSEKVRKPLVFRVTSNDGAFFSVLRVTSDDGDRNKNNCETLTTLINIFCESCLCVLILSPPVWF